MKRKYGTQTVILLGILLTFAITACSDKDPETQSAGVEPSTPIPLSTVPDPNSDAAASQGFEDFRKTVRGCLDELANSDEFLGMLYGQYYQGSGSGYAPMYNGYSDLMGFMPMARGMDAVTEDLCKNGIQNSLLSFGGLAKSGRFNPFDIDRFVGDMGLAVTNQPRLSNLYSGIGNVYLTPIQGGKYWNVGVPAIAAASNGPQIINNYTIDAKKITTVNNDQRQTVTNTVNNIVNNTTKTTITGNNNTANTSIVASPNTNNSTSNTPSNSVNPGTTTVNSGSASPSIPRGVMLVAKGVIRGLRDYGKADDSIHEAAAGALGRRFRR